LSAELHDRCFETRNFARKRDAEAFDSDIRRRRRLGDLELLDSGRETLADFAREWWQVYAMESLEPKTRKVYAEMWDKHVLTRLGGLELRRITPEVVERYQAELRAAGLGDASIRKVLAILQSILQRAVIWRRITSNPVAAVRKPPQRRKRAIDPLAPISVERLRAAMLARQRLGR
jgi:integrase